MGRSRDYKLFKVPSFPSLKLTEPYMHDGSKSTLKAVVDAYNLGATAVPMRDTDIRPLGLNATEVNDLVTFLNAL